MTAYPRIAARSFRASAAETAVQVGALGRTAARSAQALVYVHAFLLRVAVITLGTLAFVPTRQVDAQRTPSAGTHVIALVDIDTLWKIDILTTSSLRTQSEISFDEKITRLNRTRVLTFQDLFFDIDENTDTVFFISFIYQSKLFNKKKAITARSNYRF